MAKKPKPILIAQFNQQNWGRTLTLYRRTKGGRFYYERNDPELGQSVQISLGHSDLELARYEARKAAEALVCGEPVKTAPPDPTVARLTALYKTVRTPRKGHGEQLEDKRRIEFWLNVLGAQTDIRTVQPEAWLTVSDQRRSGAIDSHGRPVEEGKRRPVRDTAIASDLLWLRQLAGWACRRRDTDHGGMLLEANPFLSDEYTIPRELNPRRPVVTSARFAKLQAVASQVRMETREGTKRMSVETPLAVLLDVAWFTGHRISAILSLRIEDLHLGEPRMSSISWPAATDKMGRAHQVPIADELAASLKRYLTTRSAIGGLLFPSPTDPTKPVAKELAHSWLLEAEQRAELDHLPGGAWHPFRRGWATSRKHLPLADVALAGGWEGTRTLEKHYIAADADTLYQVVSGGVTLGQVQQR
jgi:integrase